MKATTVGAAVGTVLALTWVAVGFWAFTFVALAMCGGALVGHVVQTRPDLRALTDALRGGRSSSRA
jgi:uncharacterized membrane protein